MRKKVEIHPELGSLHLCMRNELFDIVAKQYPHTYCQHFANWQISFFVEGGREPQLVAHAYARETKKPADLWYYKILLPEEVKASLPKPPENKPLIKPEPKKPLGFRIKLNLRVEKLRTSTRELE